jgi:protein TonB
MSNIRQTAGQLEPLDQDFVREPLGKPMIFAILFHVAIFTGGLGFALLSGLFPHSNWGGANDGGAIAVQLVSSALPLPADRPPNDNVLATDKPSDAPAPPTPKSQATVDNSAIPIATKVEPPKKAADKKQEASKTPKAAPQETISKASPHPVVTPNQDKARYGEQSSSSMARTMQPTTTSANGQVSVTAGTRGFNYPFYVETIQRKVYENTRMGEVDPRTPRGTRVYVLFTIRRDGSMADLRVDKSSGSPTLDQACQHAVRRVDTFGPLPSPASEGNLSVSYYCDYN